MAMMEAVRIVESQNTSIVPAMDGGVDVCQVVTRNDYAPFFPIAPYLVAQQAASRFWLQFEALLFKQGFVRQFGHLSKGVVQVCFMLAHLMGCGWSSELVRSPAGASLVLYPADPVLPVPDSNGNLQLLANNDAADSDWSVNEPGPRFCFSAKGVAQGLC